MRLSRLRRRRGGREEEEDEKEEEDIGEVLAKKLNFSFFGLRGR